MLCLYVRVRVYLFVRGSDGVHVFVCMCGYGVCVCMWR